MLTDVREADVGSILGFGFAPFTGGTLSYIDFMGAANSWRSATASPSKHGAALQAEPAAPRDGEDGRDVLWKIFSIGRRAE